MTNPYSLKGKKILITGASSGIGRAVAFAIDAAGGEVILTARNEDRLKEIQKNLQNPGVEYYVADLTKNDQLEKLCDFLPSIDGIFHSAGIVKPCPVHFIKERQINEVFSINYIASVLLTSRLLKSKKINKGASIIFMSSISSEFTHKGGALYAGSKAALNAFSKTIALEYAHKKIRSNCILAAMVKTPIFDEAAKAITLEKMEEHGANYPLGFGEPEDVANAAVFLLSDGSRWITGTQLVMDGGLTIG